MSQAEYMKTALRLPRDLHSRLLTVAELSGRSLNAEILFRLEASFASAADSVEARFLIVEREMEAIRHAFANDEYVPEKRLYKPKAQKAKG